MSLVLLAVAASLARPLIRRWLETPPSLAVAAELIRLGQFDGAERSLSTFLDRHPDHREANILLAQVLIDRPDPRPDEALERLKRVRTNYPVLRAVVLVQQGKAHYIAHRLARSEAAWTEARKLNPVVPEAGWLLIQQYYLQGRDDEARRLALELHPKENDPYDRVRYLLELVREDVEHLAAAGVIPWLEPAVKADAKDKASALGLGRALVKEGRAEEGLRLLRETLSNSPDDPAAWQALLGGLADAGEIEQLEKELGRLPRAIAGERRFAVYRGRVAQERQRYPEAIVAYSQALELTPDDPKLIFRMARSLRLAGRETEAKRYEAREAEITAALKEQKEVYKDALAIKTLGAQPEPLLYQRIANLRERLGRSDEALAWHRLVLRDDPQNLVSRLAAERLSLSTKRPEAEARGPAALPDSEAGSYPESRRTEAFRFAATQR
jgi:predicted Zn-dependent protease